MQAAAAAAAAAAKIMRAVKARLVIAAAMPAEAAHMRKPMISGKHCILFVTHEALAYAERIRDEASIISAHEPATGTQMAWHRRKRHA